MPVLPAEPRQRVERPLAGLRQRAGVLVGTLGEQRTVVKEDAGLLVVGQDGVAGDAEQPAAERLAGDHLLVPIGRVEREIGAFDLRQVVQHTVCRQLAHHGSARRQNGAFHNARQHLRTNVLKVRRAVLRVGHFQFAVEQLANAGVALGDGGGHRPGYCLSGVKLGAGVHAALVYGVDAEGARVKIVRAEAGKQQRLGRVRHSFAGRRFAAVRDAGFGAGDVGGRRAARRQVGGFLGCIVFVYRRCGSAVALRRAVGTGGEDRQRQQRAAQKQRKQLFHKVDRPFL